MVQLSGNRNFIRFIQENEPSGGNKGDLWLKTGSGPDAGLKKFTGNKWTYIFKRSHALGQTGIFGGGYDGSNRLNTIDQVTISSPSNASDFGDLTVSRNNLSSTSNSLE